MTDPVIAVLGSINMDLVTTTRRRASPGETVFGTGFTTLPGGKGANQAIAARRAGAEVEFVGAVGSDVFADDLHRALTDAGVGTKQLRTVPGPSGVASIVVDGFGENSIIVVPGANGKLTDLGEDDLAVIAAADVLLCQYEIPTATILAAARHARAHATVVVFNPSPVQALPADLVANLDVVVVNSTEALAYGSALNPVPHLVITRGGSGATWFGPREAELTVPAFPVDVVDTTGAGDSFAGALAATWHLGPATALQWASAAGALATTNLGATAAIPERPAIQALLRDHGL